MAYIYSAKRHHSWVAALRWGSFQSFWSVLGWRTNEILGPTDWNRERFSDVFCLLGKKILIISNLTSGFRTTEIYPFDKDVLPYEAFAPSLPIQKSIEASLNIQKNTDSEHDYDDQLPLAELRRSLLKTSGNRCSGVFPTPDFAKKTVSIKRKSLNYKVLEVKNEIFKAIAESNSVASISSNSTWAITNSLETEQNNATNKKWECVICYVELNLIWGVVLNAVTGPARNVLD